LLLTITKQFVYTQLSPTAKDATAIWTLRAALSPGWLFNRPCHSSGEYSREGQPTWDLW